MRSSTMILVLGGMTACFEDGGVDLDTGYATEGSELTENDCAVDIPDDALMVEDGRTVDATGAVWVCSGGDLQSDGAEAELFVETNGTVVVNGASSIVWARNGSTITNYASDVTISTDDPSGVNDLTFSATVIECDVEFDRGC